jgi:flagellar FliJ protein
MQNILRVKEKMEDQVKLEFALAQTVYRKEEKKLIVLIKRNETYLEDGKKMREETLHVKDIKENKAAILQMDIYIKDQENVLMEAQRALDKVKEKLMLVMRERKTHEILKESAYEVYKKEEQVKESMEIDELVSYVYGKKGE